MPQPQQQAQQQEQAQPKPSRATMNRWEYLDMVRKNFPFAKGLENKELWKMLTDKNPDAKNWKFKDSPRDIQNKEEQKATSIFLNELNLKNPNKTPRDEHADNINKLINQTVTDSVFKEIAKIDKPDTVYTKPAPIKPAYDPRVHGFGYTGTLPLTLEEFPHAPYITPEGETAESNILTASDTDKPLDQNPTKWRLFPTFRGGKPMSDQQIDEMLASGEHFGVYDSKEELEEADGYIHDEFARQQMMEQSKPKEMTPLELEMVKRWREYTARVDDKGLSDPEGKGFGPDYWKTNKTYLRELSRIEKFFGTTIHNSVTGEAVKWLLNPITDDDELFERYLLEDMNTGEEIASIVLSFLLPLDKLAFLKGGKLTTRLIKKGKDNAVNLIARKGVPLKLAQKSVDAGWLRIAERMTMSAGGMGTHSTLHQIFIAMNDEQKHNMSEFVENYLAMGSLGGLAAGAGGVTGRVVSRLPKLQRALRGHSGSVLDFIAEAAVFVGLGPILSGQEVPKEWEGKIEFYGDEVTHTAGVLLGIRFLLGGAKGYPHETILKGEGAKIEKALRERVDAGENIVEATKAVAEQMELPLEMSSKKLSELSENIEKDTKQLDLFEREVDKVVEKAAKTEKAIRAGEKTVRESQHKLDRAHAKNEIKLAISEGRHRDAGKLAYEITKQGENPDIIIQEARKELLKESGTKVTRRRKKFINISTHGATRASRGRADKIAETDAKLDKFKDKGQDRLWGVKMPIPEPKPVTRRAKLKKVKDMRTKKGDKVIAPTKEYKSIEDAQRAADKIRSENVPENVIFVYTAGKNGKILMKAIIRKADVGKGKFPMRTEKSLGQETTNKPKPRSFPKKESPVKVVRNPMEATTNKKRLELLEKEKGELTHGLNNEIMRMEELRRELARHGVISIEKNPQIVALKNSVEHRRELLRQNERNRTATMDIKELSTVTLLGLPKKARGAVGKDVQKGKTKEEKRIDSHFKHIMREWVRRAESAGANAEKAFVDFIGRKGVSDPLVREYMKDNFQKLRREVGIENALEMLDAVQHGDFSAYEPRPADPNIRPAKQDSPEKYSGPKKISMHSPELQSVIRAVNERIGRQYDEENIRRRYEGKPVTMQEMRSQSRHVRHQREVYDMIVTGKGGSLDFEKHIMLVTDNLKTAQKAWNAHPDSHANMQLFALHLETLHKLATVWGKAGKALQEKGRPDRKALIRILQLNEGGAVQMADLLKMVEATYGVENARPSRSSLWLIAEFTRNMKLASISSYAKSVIGNTAMTMMEMSARTLRPALAGAFSWASGKPSGISRHEVFTLGRANAFSKGLLDKRDGGFRVAWELLKENEAYVKENPYLTNEGFGKDIPTFVGKAIRTPQNLHGALDAIYRIPWTHRWAYELAQRAAVRELRGKGMPLSVRNVAELTDKYISEHKDYFFNDAKAKAREQVYQKELGEIGRGINKLRTQAHWSGAFLNILAPFVVTHTNVFKKLVEFSPLGVLNKPILDMLIDIGQRPFYLMKGKKGTELTKGDPDLAAEYGGRVIVGTAIMGLTHSVISSMLENKFEGSWADKTKEEKELLINMGKTPYSIQIGGKNWDIRGIDPVSMYINMMVSYAQAPEEKGLKGKVLKAAGELAEYISNHPIAMLTSDWAQFTKDEKSAGRIIGRLSSSMWQPTLSRQLKRLEDPQRYRDVMAGDVSTDGDYYTYKEAGTEAVRVHNMKFFDSYIENRWPQQDIFGMPVIQRSDAGLLLGIRSYDVEDNPARKKVYEEYLRLFDNNLGVSKFGRVGSEITKGNIKIKLSHEEQHVINHYIGKAYFDLMNEDMESPQYKKLTSPDGKKSDDNRKREFWIKRRNSKYKKIYTGLDKDQNPIYNEVGVVEYVKHYLLKDMVNLAKSLDRMDREHDFGRDSSFYELRGNRYEKELKRIAPNISDEEIAEVIELTRAGPSRSEDAGQSNFEKAISIMRKNMPWEQRDFVDEAYKIRERTGVGKSAYER